MASLGSVFDLPEHCYRLSAKAVVFNDKGQVLVIEEDGDDHWDLPGGGVKHDEDMLVALRRELQEEIGLSVATAKFAGVSSFKSNDGIWALWLLYECEFSSYDFELGDANKIAWLAPTDIGYQPVTDALNTLTKL